MSDIPQFLSVIKTKALLRNKILIPKKIVRKCGESLTDQACFRLPCGLDWKIDLSKSSDGKVWIDKGWPEFLKHYSIAFGHILVFEYQGNSRFKVAIFDKTTIEINYKRLGKEVKEEPKDDENMDTCPIPCPSKSTEGYRSVPPGTSLFKGALSAIEKSKALKRISSLKFNDPFFILHIQPSHVQAKPFLTVPLDFAKSYIGTGIKHMILKVVGDGKNKSWPVRYTFKEGSHRPRVWGGWKAFTQDNALKRGDLCVFEMTKTIKSNIFAVSIYRGNRNADSTPVPGRLSTMEKSEALKRISSFKFKEPFFISHIHPSHLQANKHLTVPLDFAKSYIGTGIKHMILKVGDGKNKSWPVKYTFTEGMHRPTFFAGWKAFAHDNALKRGDICVFAMTKTNKSIIFVVSIYQENRNADSTSLPGVEPEKANPVCSERNKRSRKTLTPLPMKSAVEEDPKGVLAEKDGFNGISKAAEAASKFCSRHPLFQVDFPSSSLEMSTLSIPVWFARSYLEAKEQGVTLQVGERSWDVRLEYHISNGYSLPQFHRGWFVFVNENFLGARDSCIFELIQRDHAVFKVSIFRDQV